MHQPSCCCGSTSKPPKGQVMGETKSKRPIRNEPLQNLRGEPHEAQKHIMKVIYKQRGEKFIITTFKEVNKEGQAYF